MRRLAHPLSTPVALTVLLSNVLAACAQTASTPSPSAQPSTPRRPNVLLIVADDLGYSDLGAFGSEIPTPHLDGLAAQGRLLTRHYVAPTCSPTRAMLMSGADNHLTGLGTMGEIVPHLPPVQGKPGYEGYLNERALSLPEILRDAGYHTYMAGKWHLGAAPTQVPAARGFEASFALMEGGGSHFAPVAGQLIEADKVHYMEDQQPAQLPANFYSSDSYTSKLIGYIDRHRGDGKPFFGYLAFTAPHWPLHAPDEDIAKFAGRYDAGYDAIRQARLARQRQLGLVPPNEPANPGIAVGQYFPSWQQLTPEQRRVEARKMEVYAAMVHNLDRNVGRLIQHLKDIGEYDNTLVIFQSDNGAEATPSFYPNNEHTNNRLDNLGRRQSNFGYGVRWAEVSATPFRLFKGYSTEGGVVSPTIVRLPGQTRPLPMLKQSTHVTDMAPTILAVAGVPAPGNDYRGRPVHPMSGLNLVPALSAPANDPTLATRVVAGELFGGRYVRDGQWKLVSVTTPFADNRWELYDLSQDQAEMHNLAAQHPDVVRRLSSAWDDYARRSGVIFAPLKRAPDVRWGAPAEGTTTSPRPKLD